MNIEIIIARCTRDGHVAWSQVARQLGRSVDSVRAQHDPTYLRAYVWAPSREADPDLEPPIDENDTSSPHVKPERLKVRVLEILLKNSGSAETVANLSGTTLGCAKWQLSVMKREGLIREATVYPSGSKYERTWVLTIIGKAELAKARQANASPARVRA